LKLLLPIIITILSSSSFNLPKTLLEDASHNIKTASSQFYYVHNDVIDPETHLTIFVPDENAFADASATGYKSLPVESKSFVLKCRMISIYLPLSLLRHTAKVSHLQPTVGTEITGIIKKFMLNISATVNGSVAVSNTFVRAIVTRTVFDHSPIVIYGVFKVLLSRDLPQIPPPMTADVAAANV
jgi:hypothetical protein